MSHQGQGSDKQFFRLCLIADCPYPVAPKHHHFGVARSQFCVGHAHLEALPASPEVVADIHPQLASSVEAAPNDDPILTYVTENYRAVHCGGKRDGWDDVAEAMGNLGVRDSDGNLPNAVQVRLAFATAKSTAKALARHKGIKALAAERTSLRIARVAAKQAAKEAEVASRRQTAKEARDAAERDAKEAKAAAIREAAEARAAEKRAAKQAAKEARARAVAEAATKAGIKLGPKRMKHGKSGYITIRVPPNTPGAIKGTMLEHRWVMQQHLGRPLLKTETVHHRDGVRDHNAIENLELKAGAHGMGIEIPDAVFAAIRTLKLYVRITAKEEASLLRRVHPHLQRKLKLVS